MLGHSGHTECNKYIHCIYNIDTKRLLRRLNMSKLSTFRFDEKLTNTIEELQKSSNASSKAEIVGRAITLLKLVQDAIQNGETLVLRKGDAGGSGSREREIILPR